MSNCNGCEHTLHTSACELGGPQGCGCRYRGTTEASTLETMDHDAVLMMRSILAIDYPGIHWKKVRRVFGVGLTLMVGSYIEKLRSHRNTESLRTTEPGHYRRKPVAAVDYDNGRLNGMQDMIRQLHDLLQAYPFEEVEASHV